MLEIGSRPFHQPARKFDIEPDRLGNLADEMDAIPAVHIVGRLRPIAPPFDDGKRCAILLVGQRQGELAIASSDLVGPFEDHFAADRSEKDGRSDRLGGEAEAGVDRRTGPFDGTAKRDKGVREIIAIHFARIKADLDRSGCREMGPNEDEDEKTKPVPQLRPERGKHSHGDSSLTLEGLKGRKLGVGRTPAASAERISWISCWNKAIRRRQLGWVGLFRKLSPRRPK